MLYDESLPCGPLYGFFLLYFMAHCPAYYVAYYVPYFKTWCLGGQLMVYSIITVHSMASFGAFFATCSADGMAYSAVTHLWPYLSDSIRKAKP